MDDDERVQKGPGGRPTKLDPEIQNTIVTAIRAGAYVETAVKFAGITKDTFYRWLDRAAVERERVNGGENGRRVRARELPFVEFSDAVLKAAASSELDDLVIINNARVADWHAAAWKLERKYPKRWGRKERMEVTGAEGGPLEISLVELAQKAAMSARVEAQKALPAGGEAV